MIYKYPINLHKGMTALVVRGMMIYYGNFTTPAWVYLALHGSYGILWLIKDRLFPDQQWEKKVSVPYGVFVFFALGLYWIAPFVLISQRIETPPYLIGIAVAMSMIGGMLHFASDAQKYFTLKYHRGLITEGFFSRSRNMNYLGEVMIYGGFALTSYSPWGWIGLAVFFAGAFIPNMLKKDKSLSRYPEFAAYKERSGLMLPKLFRSR